MSTLFDLPEPPKTRDQIPRWITNAETELGAPLTLASGKTKPHKCPTCGAWTLTGYDAHIMATQVFVDPFLATPKNELAAIILGIPTYNLWGNPPRFELTPRHQPDDTHPIGTENPANPGTTNVVIAHTHKPPLANLPLPQANTADQYTDPPF